MWVKTRTGSNDGTDGSDDLGILRIDEPAVVKSDAKQVEDDQFGRVLEVLDARELHVDIEPCLCSSSEEN